MTERIFCLGGSGGDRRGAKSGLIREIPRATPFCTATLMLTPQCRLNRLRLKAQTTIWRIAYGSYRIEYENVMPQ
jgi:hypothetical protein